MRTSTGSISVTNTIQNTRFLAGNRKYTMAKADSSEIAILPMAMISALARLMPIIGNAGATVAPVVAGVLWLMMFASPYGVVRYALIEMGLDWNHLLNANHAMALIVLAAIWKHLSYNFLFFLAGLQSIPTSLIEAATIDGASPWKRFWTIVFPLLSPTTFFLLVINIIYAFFETFAIVDAATHGGPGKETAILIYKLYYDGFKALDINGSAAQSVVLMAIVVALTVAQFRFVEKKVHY